MKVLTSMSNAFGMAQAKHGSFDTWTADENDTSYGDAFKRYMGDSLKIEKLCETASECGIGENMSLNVLSGGPMEMEGQELTYDNLIEIFGPKNTLLLGDGSIIIIENLEPDYEQGGRFMIDTNGVKKPNTIGRDLFEFYMYKTKRGWVFAPNLTYDCGDGFCAAGGKEYIDNTLNNEGDDWCCKTDTYCPGLGCGARILWKGKMDY